MKPTGRESEPKMGADKLTVVRLDVDATAAVIEIEDSNEAFRAVVGGGLEARRIFDLGPYGHVVLYLDDGGLLKDRTANLWGAVMGPFVGTGLLVISNRAGRDRGFPGDWVPRLVRVLDEMVLKALHGAGLDLVIGQGEEAVRALDRERLEILGLHPGEPFMCRECVRAAAWGAMVKVKPKPAAESDAGDEGGSGRQ
jgi:hypothetical protein